MKKKIIIFTIIILFVCSLSLFSIKTNADSGWDGSYDSDSSWDSGSDWGSSGWSSDDSWSHSSGGSYYDSGSSSDADILFIIICYLFVIIFSIIKVVYRDRKRKNNNSEIVSKVLSEEEIQKIYPQFNYEKFKEQAYETYKQIQIAWMNFDYDELQKYCTNELYNLYKTQLEALKIKNQQNIMGDFALIKFGIIDMEKSEDSISLVVKATIKCSDYVIDTNTKEEVRGKSTNKIYYDYEMTFIKSLNEKENICPNCGATLENRQSNVCMYCRSTIISNSYDWVLSKKQVKGQYYGLN